jgi:hypothetical protein
VYKCKVGKKVEVYSLPMAPEEEKCSSNRAGSLCNDNGKTIKSFDLTTVCAKVQAGKPCAYCYVETARKDGFRAKAQIDRIEYDNWVVRMDPQLIARLNAVGGVRMFSFGDYDPRYRDDVTRFLGDCYLAGLYAKAVTKVPAFIAHHHDHAAISVIHLSVDNLRDPRRGSPVTFDRARRMREQYRKVLIRAVCLSPEDLEFFGKQDWCDILTLNHGNNGFHRFTKDERRQARERYGDRLCCAASICADCTVRCGVDKVSDEDVTSQAS